MENTDNIKNLKDRVFSFANFCLNCIKEIKKLDVQAERSQEYNSITQFLSRLAEANFIHTNNYLRIFCERNRDGFMNLLSNNLFLMSNLNIYLRNPEEVDSKIAVLLEKSCIPVSSVHTIVSDYCKQISNLTYQKEFYLHLAEIYYFTMPQEQDKIYPIISNLENQLEKKIRLQHNRKGGDEFPMSNILKHFAGKAGIDFSNMQIPKSGEDITKIVRNVSDALKRDEVKGLLSSLKSLIDDNKDQIQEVGKTVTDAFGEIAKVFAQPEDS